MAEVIVVRTNTGYPRKCCPALIGSESREAFLDTERVPGNATDRPQVATDCHCGATTCQCHWEDLAVSPRRTATGPGCLLEGGRRLARILR